MLLVKREQVIAITEYTPIEKVLMDMFLPIAKFKHPGQAHIKEKMVRGALHSTLGALERTLRGPLKSLNEGALPLEQASEAAKQELSEHMKQFTTPAQATNHPQTTRLARNQAFNSARLNVLQDLQNAYKTVYFQVYGEPWHPYGTCTTTTTAEEYDATDAVNEYFKDIPEVVTSMHHGISGGGKVAKASARKR